jgi:hypothetical protein
MNISIPQLVEETLNYTREYRYPDSCLVFNQAAQELRLRGEEALPAIEHAIQESVVPAAGLAADHHALLSKFFGLMNLWMAYIAIAGPRHLDRVIQFMRPLHGTVLATAILSLRASWPYDEGSRIEMPKAYLNFVREVARGSGIAAEVARNVISLLDVG